MTTLELGRTNPQAWYALPQAYRNDSVLTFKVDKVTGKLTARPSPSQRRYIGDWIAVWDPIHGWYDAATGEYYM